METADKQLKLSFTRRRSESRRIGFSSTVNDCHGSLWSNEENVEECEDEGLKKQLEDVISTTASQQNQAEL